MIRGRYSSVESVHEVVTTTRNFIESPFELRILEEKLLKAREVRLAGLEHCLG